MKTCYVSRCSKYHRCCSKGWGGKKPTTPTPSKQKKEWKCLISEAPVVDPEAKWSEVCFPFLTNLVAPLHAKLINMQSNRYKCPLRLSSLVCNLPIWNILRTVHVVFLTQSPICSKLAAPKGCCKDVWQKWAPPKAIVVLSLFLPIACLVSGCPCHHRLPRSWAG